MKPVQVSQDILPVGELKTHTSRVLRRLRNAQRPIVITLNGKPAAVLITPEEFDRLYERERFVEAVGKGLADAEAGRVVGDEALSDELDAEFGAHET